MAASTNTLGMTAVQADISGIQLVNRTVGPVVYNGSVGQLLIGNLPSSSQTAVALPTTTVLQAYVKNTTPASGASSSQPYTIDVLWTPGSSGVLTSIGRLQAGNSFIGFALPASSSQSGISALQLIASTPNTSFECFLGG